MRTKVDTTQRNNNKEDLRGRSCHLHKLARDKSALTLICGRDEESQPSILRLIIITMVMCYNYIMEA